VSDDPTVVLSVAGRRFTFTERSTCLVGRADDCEPTLPADDMQVSRHHCLFDINPPDVRVRDFGSLNGTFLNGEEIGRRKPGETPEEGARTVFPERDLANGDEIRLGRTLLRVEIAAVKKVRTRAYCAHCGRDAELDDRDREGDIVCAFCRKDPRELVRKLMARALEDDALASLRGYEVTRELGRGGQGVVYLATHLDTGRQVALKVLLAQVAVQGRARSSFLREIDSSRALRHSNIVSFYDSGSYGASFYLACEYCESGSLEDLLLARGGTLTPDEAVPITLQMLDGLQHAAELGLVHRDIKPSNVLLAGDIAKIGDFGLAKAFDQAGLSGLTRTGTTAGTVAYMPRAQLINFKYAKPEVDVWATAATLYAMLTGTTPRDFPPSTDPILVVLQKPPVPVRQRNPALPRRLAEVIDEALIDNPRITVTSADTFKQALQEAMS
jgi:hypothetical protein